MKKKPSRRQSKHTRDKAPIPVGVAWYTEPEWLKIKASAEDADGFCAFHAEWEAMAEERLIKLGEVGIIPVKIPVQADELFAFCAAEGMKNNGAGRASYAQRRMEMRLIEAGKGRVC